LADLTLLVSELQTQIGDEYRAYDCECKGARQGRHEEDCLPSMQVTIGADAEGWGWQSGDNSYTGGAYGYQHWGVGTLTREDDATAFARELLADLEAQVYDDDDKFFFDE
jgi:hypothetical protein